MMIELPSKIWINPEEVNVVYTEKGPITEENPKGLYTIIQFKNKMSVTENGFVVIDIITKINAFTRK